jgi:ankyrin repeat protein
MYSCHNNNLKTVKLLLSKGADVNLQNKDGMTALMYSCHNNNLETVKLLLSKGADVTITNINNQKAIDLTNDDKIKKELKNEELKLIFEELLKSEVITETSTPVYENIIKIVDKHVNGVKRIILEPKKDLV